MPLERAMSAAPANSASIMHVPTLPPTDAPANSASIALRLILPPTELRADGASMVSTHPALHSRRAE